MRKHNHKQKGELLSIDGIVPKFAVAVPKPKYRLGRVIANSYFNIVVACFVLIVCAQLSNIGSTVSYFNEIESSLGNFFVADPLYFMVAPATTTIALGQGDTLLVATMTPGEGSDPLQYSVMSLMTGGDPVLCNAINILTTAPFPYDGPLIGLGTGMTTYTGPWALTVSLAPGIEVTPDTDCSFDLVYRGWNASSTPGQGYSDTQKVSLTFTYAGTPAPSSSGAPVSPDRGTAPPVDATTTGATSTPDESPPPADAPVVPDTATSTQETPPATPPADAPADVSAPPADPPPSDVPAAPPVDSSGAPPADPPPADASAPAPDAPAQ